MVELNDGAGAGEGIENAGWKSGGTYTPSAADAWAHHKRDDQARIVWWKALSKTEQEQALDRAGDGSHIPTSVDAWREHKSRLGLEQSTAAGRTARIAVGDLAKDGNAYFETFGDDPHG